MLWKIRNNQAVKGQHDTGFRWLHNESHYLHSDPHFNCSLEDLGHTFMVGYKTNGQALSHILTVTTALPA